MANDSFSIDLEFVLLGFATKNRMIFDNEDGGVWPGDPSEEQCRSDSTDPAADDHAVISLAGVDRFGRLRVVAHFVPGGENFKRVAVRFGVLADATVPTPFIGGG